MPKIEWRCRVCDRPIGDGDGYLEVDLRAVSRTESAWDAWEKNLWVGPPPLLPRVQWRVHHAACDPDPDSYTYWIEVSRARSHADLLAWSAHLMGKRWFRHTDWADLIRRQAGVNP